MMVILYLIQVTGQCLLFYVYKKAGDKMADEMSEIYSIPISKYQVNEKGAMEYVLTWNTQEIAELLGLSYNVEDNIMYAGNNPKTGFRYEIDSSNPKRFYIYVVNNGTKMSNKLYDISLGGIYNLYYRHTEKVTVFGITQPHYTEIKVAVSKYAGSKEGYGYIMHDFDNHGMAILLDTGEYEYIGSPGNEWQNQNVISMCPIVSSTAGVYFPHVYISIAFRGNIIDAIDFEINTKKYISAKRNAGLKRFIAEL